MSFGLITRSNILDAFKVPGGQNKLIVVYKTGCSHCEKMKATLARAGYDISKADSVRDDARNVLFINERKVVPGTVPYFPYVFRSNGNNSADVSDIYARYGLHP